MTLEHPYKGLYLDQQFRASLREHRRNGHPRRRPQAVRMVRRSTWLERVVAAALLLGAACSLLIAVLLAVGLIWLIAQVVQDLARGWRGW